MRWICPEQLFDGQTLRPDLALGVQAGAVQQIAPLSDLPHQAERISVSGTITAGFVDLQVNGGGGVMFNNAPSPAGLASIVAAHRVFGTVALLPTLITDSPAVLARAVDTVLAQRDSAVLGLHIEGPHISPARRGTHDFRHIRPLDTATITQIDRLISAGLIVKITLAPEAVQPGQVRALVQKGAIVSIGHSDATAAQTRALLDEGAQCFTHLFNAMSPMLGRAAGVTGAAISSSAYCGIICDGHHVGDEMLALAIRARPVADRVFLVSDAMATVGGATVGGATVGGATADGANSFDLYGQKISLENGRLINSEGALAGAHLTMLWALQRLIEYVHISPEVALKMAVSNPCALIGRPGLAGPLGRPLGDLLVLDTHWQLQCTCDQMELK